MAKNGIMASKIPGRFTEEEQLDSSLVLVDKHIERSKSTRGAARNFPPNLPGHPMRFLRNTSDSDAEIIAFLQTEFITPRLNRMAPHLWVMATMDHTYISPLHEQVFRGRQIIITEKPELHLTWIDDRVFIKPIPPYLTSYAFWERYLPSAPRPSFEQKVVEEEIQPAILGYLRSWTYLVRHESDFLLAMKANLIPNRVSHAQLMRFISNFEYPTIQDAHVSPRYKYGQLRLSRLNVWAKFFLGTWEFEQVYWQYWQYFQTYYGPLLFIFAVFSVVLGAMQVGLTSPHIWPAFQAASLWFSVVTLLLTAATAVLLILLFAMKSSTETIFALHARIKHRMTKT